MKVTYPSRVTMLDAHSLDSEVFNILKLQSESIMRVFPQWLISKVEFQRDMVLHFLIWKLSVNKVHGTFGQQLLNTKYDEDSFTRMKSYILCLEKLVTCYCTHYNVGDLYLTVTNKASVSFNWVVTTYHVLEMLNLLWFFQEGKYPKIIDRILSLRPVCIVNKSREVGYRYMTRELIWHGFIELAGFTLTLINYQSLRRKLWRIFLFTKRTASKKGQLIYSDSTKCEVCNDIPILPQHIGCSHVFCYYCIQTNRLIDAKYDCPSCGHYQEEILFYST